MKIKFVKKNSPAYKAGLKCGDSIIRINSHPILDKLSLIYSEKSGLLNIEYVRNKNKHHLIIKKHIDTPLGIEINDIIRRCSNKCIFCFEMQLPKDARSSLRLRDDDYALSYVTGSYITLTNLTDYDRERIVNERLSPLYLSVHTTDNTIRQYLLGNKKATDILKTIGYFTSKGIEFHTQFVICPGINDGDILEKSIQDMEKFFPHILSISIIPVGLTRFRKDLPYIKSVDERKAINLINLVAKYQKIFKKKYGNRIIYASDEFFLIAKSKIPGNAYYENYPQYDNGVGLIRSYIEEVKQMKNWKNRNVNRKILMITGQAFKSYLKLYSDILMDKFHCEVDILSIENDYFGDTVNVAPLLSFTDIAKNLKKVANKYDRIILPPRVVNSENRFIDNHSFNELKNILKCDIMISDESFKITTLRIIEK